MGEAEGVHGSSGSRRSMCSAKRDQAALVRRAVFTPIRRPPFCLVACGGCLVLVVLSGGLTWNSVSRLVGRPSFGCVQTCFDAALFTIECWLG